MTPEARALALRALAAELEGVDREVYAACGRDPLEPVIGGGPRGARVGLFGRDPGRDEIRHGVPFVGAGGRKIRDGLHRAVHGVPAPDAAAALRIGQGAFWANTVPYKPIGNKAWSRKVKLAFRPLIADLLVHDWEGEDLLVFGLDAFLWFGLEDRPTLARLEAHQAREDRYEAPIEVELAAPDGARRALRLRPLPHPSPLNATWAPAFPGLLDRALAAVGGGAAVGAV